MNRGLPSARRVLLFGLGLLLVTAVAVLCRRAIDASETRTVSQPARRQSSSEVSYKQYVRVWVHADDISSDVARVRPGRVILVAENLTHCDIDLVLEQVIAGQSGQVMAIVAASALEQRAYREMQLSAGEYIFYEQSNPGVKGKLFVESE